MPTSTSLRRLPFLADADDIRDAFFADADRRRRGRGRGRGRRKGAQGGGNAYVWREKRGSSHKLEKENQEKKAKLTMGRER